ncbi:hypothetical protein NQ315_010434, partial [Exocentrus adspersus]
SRDLSVRFFTLCYVYHLPVLIFQLPYVIAVKYSHGGRGAMLPPEMNISSTGVIPTSVQTFSIKLMCTGLKNAEIKVEIHLHVSTHKHRNATTLKFRRNKICLKGIGNSRNESMRFDSGSFGAATGSLYVAVACALAMITLVVVTTSAVCIKKKARAQEPTYMTALYDSNPHMFLRSALGRPPSAESGSYATIASVHKGPPSPSPYATSDAACQFYASSDACRVSYYASSQIMLISQVSLQDPRLVNPAKRLRSLSVFRQTISLEHLAEEGIFGKVYQGTYRQQTVMVKTTKEAASKRLVGLFLAEGTMMYGMEHKNVLTILCANLDDPKQPLLVYPYSNRGNLKRYLIKCRKKKDNIVLSTQNLVDIAIQILLGIMYLHSQNVCYKDVAVRNAVIDEKLQVKITDNSLSRDMFPNDYFCLADQESKPVKWMALESLIYNQYSAVTDVLLLYSDLETINDELAFIYFRFAVMTYCWLNCPTERPQTNQLLAYLQDFYTALCRFV